jgi:hypothetical protein
LPKKEKSKRKERVTKKIKCKWNGTWSIPGTSNHSAGLVKTGWPCINWFLCVADCESRTRNSETRTMWRHSRWALNACAVSSFAFQEPVREIWSHFLILLRDWRTVLERKKQT